MANQRFVIALVALCAILVAAYLLAHQQIEFVLDHWKAYLTIGLFALVTYISHNSMASAISERPALFANRFMASILIKLVGGAVLFICIALLSPKIQIKPYGILFILVYLVFTIFGSRQAARLKSEDGKES